MGKEEQVPSESEWRIMEVLWASETPLTSSEIIRRMEEREGVRGLPKMTPKMVRVLMNRLCGKQLVGYTVDENDARVYHYEAKKSKEACLREKSRKFADSYFSGKKTDAVAALIESCDFSEEQLKELEQILKGQKGNGGVK